ncbi:hypothetical protein HGG64_02370 [Mycoplasma phocoeninasale]|uniref:Uncharacterized protein n=1 Tax=Mycoplasma phocoeninasale TaxID=2726117 RepID=A0A858U0D8_9MOLU|nr:hypothetical protein [Mycoplasma phocoeninasale]QJG66534.1 hypothetical protein HGG64_02370 [Mycoplasma phocoeninasale]
MKQLLRVQSPQNFKDNIRLSENSTFVIDSGGTIIVKIKTEASSVPPIVKKYALIKLTLKKESKSLDFYVKFALNTAKCNENWNWQRRVRFN